MQGVGRGRKALVKIASIPTCANGVQKWCANGDFIIREVAQLRLFEPTLPIRKLETAKLGTFQDCLKAPIHRWFKYPAGFSYRFVEVLIDELRLNQSHWILDPFVGCGTVVLLRKCTASIPLG